jgi:hypothetical protein
MMLHNYITYVEKSDRNNYHIHTTLISMEFEMNSLQVLVEIHDLASMSRKLDVIFVSRESLNLA